MASQPLNQNRPAEWVKSVGALSLGLAGLAVSWAALGVQRSVADIQRSIAEMQKRNSAEELALKHETFELQRRTEGARLAASVIPFLKCNDDVLRANALQLLAKAAPDEGALFTDLLLQKCGQSTTSRTEVARIGEQSRLQQSINAFSIRLANARDYKSKGHDGPAARLFSEASGLIPSAYASKVNRPELDKAQAAFGARRFSEAADRFVLAFNDIPDFQ